MTGVGARGREPRPNTPRAIGRRRATRSGSRQFAPRVGAFMASSSFFRRKALTERCRVHEPRHERRVCASDVKMPLVTERDLQTPVWQLEVHVGPARNDNLLAQRIPNKLLNSGRADTHRRAAQVRMNLATPTVAGHERMVIQSQPDARCPTPAGILPRSPPD